MELFYIPTKYVKSPFSNFSSVKTKLVDYFDNYLPSSTSSNITKTDWSDSLNFNREWTKFILPLLEFNLLNLSNFLGYKNITINQVWFQQYTQNSFHSWHTHSSHYTGAFYVELPNGTPKTQLKVDNNILNIDAKEGEIVIFPSFISHRSPKNTSPYRKTIISFNIDLVT